MILVYLYRTTVAICALSLFISEPVASKEYPILLIHVAEETTASI